VNSQRRDLILLPVAITYERLVEESSMVGELKGEKKTKESMLGLVRARKFLENRFGTAHVCFGDPISLADTLGDRRERFRDRPGGVPRKDEEVKAIEEEKRVFVQDLAWRIVERINWTVVANATSVAASVMMGSTARGLRRRELIIRMQQIVDLLRIQDTRITKALMKDEGGFEDSIAFLLRSDLLHSAQDSGGEILYFDESRRQVLDIYRNAIAHYLAAPSFLARRLLAGSRRPELIDDLSLLQDLFYQEFLAPRAEVLALHCDAFIDHFIKSGWLDEIEGVLVASDEGIPVFMNFAEQTQSVIDAYRAACDVAAILEDELTKKEFHARVSKQFECAELLGDARRPESANQTTYANALDLLVRRGLLEAGQREVKPKKGRKEKRSRKGRAPRMERVFLPTGNVEAIERLAGELAMADLD
jgi:glycerol-3-phosphate O-acyltransferase